ncbi:MAG: YihY/virulence factor BrkB family protein [Bryobacterales bacterium]|nr:YihY/virulence factor BrkB family protein [Bryobacterales bacterium]MBV9397847.1 YihY/virulence factor BrkB family protein [Bryobacterales bacterium]
MRYIKNLFTRTFEQWAEHDAATWGAALAYYTVLSLAPLLVIAVAIAGIVFRKETIQNRIVEYVTNLMGPSGADTFHAILANVQSPKAGIIATFGGIVVLLISASGVFIELRTALNTIWDVEPSADSGIRGTIKERLRSVVMVIAIGFLLVAALLASSAIAAVARLSSHVAPPWLHKGIGNAITVIAIAVLFAIVYRYVPAKTLPWRKLWPGALATAILVTAGKYALGLYLSKATLGSAYGAAGSLVVFLAWIYYVSLLFLLGAEFTRVFACYEEGACLKMNQDGSPPN